MKLPDLSKTRCVHLTACGRIEKAANKALLKRLAKQEAPIARCRVKSRTVYIRVLAGGKGGRHLHVDYTLASVFSKGHRPNPTHKKADLMKLLDAALGSSIALNVFAVFETALGDLPESGFIRSLSKKQTEAEVSVTVTGATVAITGAPSLNKVRWLLDNKGERIQIRLEANVSTRIEATYLEELLALACELLDLFVLGKNTDAA